ncbi:MAG: DUF1499 domain-containing protein [Pseudomonadota bacterium]
MLKDMVGSLGYFGAIVLVLMVSASVWFRMAPTDPTVWHTDPAHAEPGPGGIVMKVKGGDAQAPVFFDKNSKELLKRLDAIALSEPRTKRVAGGPDEGRITYISRSLVMGFPDYTTVEAIPTDDGTQLLVHARLRYGKSDLGVNSARVQRWLIALGS